MFFAIRFYPSAHARMIVPKAYGREFHPIHSVSFGDRTCPVQCLTHNQEDNFILISSAVEKRLTLPRHRMASFHLNGENATCTIPFGVFTAGFQKRGPLLGTRTKYFEALSNAGRNHGYQSVFFGQQHLNSLPSYMTGYIYDQNIWRKIESPLPEVVHNRIPNRKAENHPKVANAFRSLRKKTHIFNPGFFNKWSVFKQLKQSDHLDHLLPKTVFHPSEAMIADMLEKENIYIKSSHGSKGEGLIRVQKTDTGSIHVTESEALQSQTFADVHSFFSSYFPQGSEGYLLQPQIRLFEIDEQPVDFRVHTNKDETGKWRATVMAARLGSKGQPTTHLTYGAQVKLVEEIFPEKKAAQITKRLESAALETSYELDRHYHQQLGELGLDIGIDQDDSLWLFEANAKPGYFIFEHPILWNQIEDYFSYIYRYSYYLMTKRS
ncbi:YheC/YheD family protein [Thalassobacillus pellis]|uniref:YheC/YheD family endospore coat-associated protein n=1 Tax=Thalassobacillus pellis TaxID=748008 RepID=UPI001961677E|nr:YheC/YheD family protein [Thalassobacillus pellis]MBM7551113.1 hypothetical protein [Thalassobacillus pellis]